MNTEATGSVAVMLSFDFDAMAPWINLGARSPSFLSRGEFGPIGVRRILDVLNERRLPATFFTPGHTALCYPDTVEAILSAGHEIGHHGWVHEPPASLAEPDERKSIELGFDALERVGVPRPVGYRAPGWELSDNSTRLLVEYGFRYDSSMMGSDFEPYWCRTGDTFDEHSPYSFGDNVPLVELPVSWHLDDVPLFDFIALSSHGTQVQMPGLRPASDVLEIWRAEFDYLNTRLQRGLYVLTMHPQVIGRGHRITMLEQLLDHIVQFPDVRFVKGGEHAKEWVAQQGSGGPSHT